MSSLLLHLQKLLPVARDQMQLPTILLIEQLQLSWLKISLFSSSCAFNRLSCSVTVHFLLRPADIHTTTQLQLRQSVNYFLQLLACHITFSTQGPLC